MIWWNRGLTKLSNKFLFKNYEQFIKKELIERKGVFIEYIKPPTFDKLVFSERASKLNLDKITINTVINIFGKKDFKLYEHQAKSLDKLILEDKKNLILAVPTATGKTEAFFIPILDYCIKNSEKRGLKAIIIYPTKTLEVDQFNRFIEYLYLANKQLSDKKKKIIKISIWDGDTPSRVGDPSFDKGSIEAGVPLRGILCPKCKEKLILDRRGILTCEDHEEFFFINAIRNRIIKTGTDILITNPEALDFLITNPDNEKLSVLGKRNSEYPLKYIVYDEGHIWKGLSGTSISLLSKRLRYFYKKNNPQFIILSATIAHPKKLAADLLNVPEERINLVQYSGTEPEKINPDTILDFTRWKYCNFSELIYIFILIDLFSDSIKELKLEENQISNFDNIIHNLNLLELIKIDGDNITLTNLGKNLLDLIKNLIEIKKKENLNISIISDKLSRSLKFGKEFKEILYKKMKELFKIVEFFDLDKQRPINFIKLEKLISKISKISKQSLPRDEWEQLIEMFLNFGQFANILINRYHFFLKSPDALFWCFRCGNITLRKTCKICDKKTFELRFCRVCHHPYMGISSSKNEKKILEAINSSFKEHYNLKNLDLNLEGKIEPDQEDTDYLYENIDKIAFESSEVEVEDDEIFFEPIGYPSSTNYCPNCNRYMPKNQLYTGGMFFTTFVSFLLSALPRLNNSHKVLVFSDSRRSAENIGSDFMKNDYSITTSRMFVNFISQNPELSIKYNDNTETDLLHLIREKLHEEYYSILIDKVKDTHGRKILNEVWKQNISILRFLNQHRHLFMDSILIIKELYEQAENTKEIIIGQELFRMFFFQAIIGFQYRSFSFKPTNEKEGAYTYSKMIDKIAKRLEFLDKREITKYLPKNINLFLELGIIDVFNNEELNETLRIEKNRLSNLLDKNKEQKFSETTLENNLNDVKSFLNEEKIYLNRVLETNYETGLIKRYKSIFKTNFHLLLLKSIYFCRNCYSIVPYKEVDDLDRCLVCKNKLILHDRITINNGELTFNQIDFNLFNIDHWGEEFINYGINKDFNNQIIKIGIHRAGLPYTIRGAIEESFRNGKINIVSSTPTMELGVDIGRLNCAVQLGIPPTLANYIQRCGRTGRSLSGISMIFTIIRNQNAIDEYYFEHIDEFFNKLDNIYIPNHETVNFIYAGHILTFILSYLARNRAFSEEYISKFALKDNYDDAKSYVNGVLERIAILRSIIIKREEEIKLELINCFGPSSVIIFDKIISKEDDISLWKKSIEFFGKIKEFSRGYGIQNLSEMYKNLISWTNLLGYLANYRGFGENMPISIESRNQVMNVDITEVKRIIRENYPGQNNKKGAIFRLSGAKYVVDKVWGSGKIGNVKICPDRDGNHPFIVINTNEDFCPFCETPLEYLTIYKIKKIIAKPARGFAYNYKTSAYISNNIERIYDKREAKEINILGLKFEIFKGKFDHISFTPAYLIRYYYQRNYTLYKSQAKIEDIVQEDIDLTDPDSFLREKPKTEEFSPIGNKIDSSGICFIVDFNSILEKIDLEDIIVFLTSFNQLLKRAISITADCELNDFEFFWIFHNKKIHYYLLDGLGGTQGISDIVYSDLSNSSSYIFKLMREFINCPVCGSKSKYCSSCLLLRRTPEFIISKGLLNKNVLKKVLL